jgi:hypothetical protein
MRQTMKDKKPAGSRREPQGKIVRLEDLLPRHEVKGGGRKRLFGQEPAPRLRRKPGGD